MNLLQDFNSGGAGAAGHTIVGCVNATPTFGSIPFGEGVAFYPQYPGLHMYAPFPAMYPQVLLSLCTKKLATCGT